MDELVDDDGIISSQNEREGTTNAKLDANSSPGSEGLNSNTRIIELRQMNEWLMMLHHTSMPNNHCDDGKSSLVFLMPWTCVEWEDTGWTTPSAK